MKINLLDFANEIVREHDLGDLIPVVEKEIVHYEILQSLSEHKLLDELSFQGGTCLRLCYKSPRYSEDLDFTAGDSFDSLDLESFGRALKDDLLKTYDVALRVKEPKIVCDYGNVGIRRWTLVVNTATARPDIPMQRIKLEVASVPSYTSELRRVNLNYTELPQTYLETLVKCQTPEEIMADKLVSFSDTEGYIRYRDLWDIPWLEMAEVSHFDEVSDFVRAKHQDYGCKKPLPKMIAMGQQRAAAQIDSPEFQESMLRFIPPKTYARTVGSKDYRSVMLRSITDTYRLIAKNLGISDEVAAARQELAAEIATGHFKESSGPIKSKTI